VKIEQTRTPEKRRERSPVKPKLERRIDRSPDGSRRREDDRRKSPRRDRSRERVKESRSKDHRDPPRKEIREKSREKSHKSDSRNGRERSRDRSDSRKERDRPSNGTSRDRKRSDDRSRDTRRSRDRSPNRTMEIAKFDDRNGGGGARGGKTNGNDWSVATEICHEPVRLAEDFADPDREPLETAYGVQFPLDFFRLYELMCKLSPVIFTPKDIIPI